MSLSSPTMRTRQQLHCVRDVAALCVLLLPTALPRVSRAEDAASAPIVASVSQALIVVVGAAGAPEYHDDFQAWAENWRRAADQAGARFTLIGAGDEEGETDRAQLERQIAAHAGDASLERLWIVLIGHGSFDGETSKFNLRGLDVSADELSQWLSAVKTPLAIINCASASAPLVPKAAAENRVVIVATKSGHEVNFTRFGRYLSEAINDPHADLDKDDQVSLLEAYLTACRGVAEFYDGDGRLATEHALLDDNGDGQGTPAAWFRGLRATQSAQQGAPLDGARAHQVVLVRSEREARLPREVRERRDAIELTIAVLREQKAALGDENYYAQLEPLLVELAKLYDAAELKSSP